jgi:hypothetical protein
MHVLVRLFKFNQWITRGFTELVYCLKAYIFYRYNLARIRIEQKHLKCLSSLRCTPSIKISRLLPRALMSPVFDTTLFHFVQFFIYLLFLSIICCLSYFLVLVVLCWIQSQQWNSHAPNVFCKLDDLWCSVWCRNIAGRCHSLQSVEKPCLVQSSLQHEDQSVSMNGFVFRLPIIQ